MKKNIITLVALTFAIGAFAQKPGVGIGVKKVSPSVALQIEANSKGVLVPRVDLAKLDVYQLTGDDKQEGVLVYNNNAKEGIPVGFYYWTNVGTPHWELITNSTITKGIIDRIVSIEEVTGAGSGSGSGSDSNGGGSVIYRPGKPGEDGKPGEAGKIVYVPKDANGKPVIDPNTGKPKEETIDIADLIAGKETNTFIKEMEVEVEGKKVNRLYYFSEQGIYDFVQAGGDAKDIQGKIEAKYGKEINVIGNVSNNFQEIINKNPTIITQIINGAKGNVTFTQKPSIPNDDNSPKEWVVTIGNGDGTSTDFKFNEFETKTSVGKTVGNGTDAAVVTNTTAISDANVKGKIIYTYYGEDKTKPYYIDVTSDILLSLTDNDAIRKEIVKVINDPNAGGDGGTGIPGGDGGVVTPTDPKNPTEGEKKNSYGNVYYGPLDPTDLTKGDVLYSIDKAGKKHYIDISQNVINEITNNKKVIEKIKEVTTVKVESGTDVPTGEIIGTKKVFKGIASVKVEDNVSGYDSTFKDFIKVKAGDDVNFGRLLKVSVLNVDGQVVVDSATDVEVNGEKEFKFYFGVGNMYAPIVNNTYEVIFEYLEK